MVEVEYKARRWEDRVALMSKWANLIDIFKLI